jgi:hypothetical protein
LRRETYSDYEEDEDPYFRTIQPPKNDRYTDVTRGIKIDRVLGDNKDVRCIPRNIRGASTKSLGFRQRPKSLKELKKLQKHNQILKKRKEIENGGPLKKTYNDGNQRLPSEDRYNKYPRNDDGKNYQ